MHSEEGKCLSAVYVVERLLGSNLSCEFATIKAHAIETLKFDKIFAITQGDGLRAGVSADARRGLSHREEGAVDLVDNGDGGNFLLDHSLKRFDHGSVAANLIDTLSGESKRRD